MVIDRRTLLLAGAALAGAPARRPPSGPDWPALAASLDGGLVRPDDADYAAARRLYNTRFDHLRPAAVAYPAGPADIAECLAFARRHAVPVAIRSGGHSYAGWSSGDGRLVVDVSRLDSVALESPSAAGAPATARIGAGARLVDVYTRLAADGRSLPGGTCPTVSVAGLALGGGHGVVSRAHGLTCDALLSATLVTADGRTLDCSADRRPDLFWALRGAGNGNFGVV
ncbi:FAD-binding oxidoreductase, partial [Streptomyces sp. URMC 123]|uniref:FAD-binding oxidoreductase n=1 Tax=Streptomyces sp. URMC 123 TaxID=3423403 RepID=UPI003F1BCED8